MSVTRNFRVTVNLSNFFHDHRNRARIFITDDIQTINDLEDRIEKIFNIHNFHLTSQNEYLPPSEDARILQKDDIIWVIQNGENHQSTHTPQVSSKKANKKSKPCRKKRSISLTDVYVEEELQSPRKKKKKKFDIEPNNEDSCSISSPLSASPKKKKKKKDKTSDRVTSGESLNNVDTETFNSHLNKKTQNKSLVNVSHDKVSTTIEEDLNASKNNAVNINTLLPVLHSHINSYNKKMSTSQLNKTSTSLMEISSSAITKECDSDDEKKQYNCKGNLAFYKKKIQLPTITDEYLNQKKVNIVKIEYLGVPETVNNKEQNNGVVAAGEDNTCFPQEILDKSSNKYGGTTAEDQIKDITMPSILLHDNLSKSLNLEITSPLKRTKPIKDVTALSNATKLSETNAILNYKTEKCMPAEKLPEALTSNVSKGTHILPDKESILAFEEQKSPCKQEINNVSSKSETEFLFNEEIPLNNTEEIKTITNILPNIGSNASQPICLSKETMNSKDTINIRNPDLNLLANTNKTSTPPVDRNFNNTANSDVTVNTTRVVLKKSNMPLRQKYFFFKGMTDNGNCAQMVTNMNKENSVSSENVYFMPAKQGLLDLQTPDKSVQDISEFQVKQLSTEILPSPIQISSLNLSAFEQSSKPNHTKEFSKTAKENSNESFTDFPHGDDGDFDMRPNRQLAENNTLINDTVNPSLPAVNSSKAMENFMEDSKIESDNSRNSGTYAMDLTKDVAIKFDSSRLSSISQESISRFSKRRQQSGVGQLLEELRGSESIISIESVDSDCSEFITKRQRKRVRKRKKKNAKYNSDTSLNDSSLIIAEPPVQQRPLNVKACPSIHIKFEEGEGEELKVIDITKDKSAEVDNESYIENITLRSDMDESKTEIPNIREEEILKSPSMKKMLPKIGDLIAFKILRITDSYTPEISSYITGKVIDFNTESKQIVYEILSGLDQCEEPKGKLSLEVDGKNIETSNSRREFIWLDLIDPRLLYP